jgi:ATP-dependent RNA helicase DDX3X
LQPRLPCYLTRPPQHSAGHDPIDDDPFKATAKEDAEADTVFAGENTGINFDAYEDIPVDTSGKDCPDPINDFESVNFPEGLLKNVRRCKYSKPTPVQRYSIPIGQAGRDLMACAQTGSGKTAAFCFPIIANILTSGMEPIREPRKAFPLALVLSPTRELSTQIFQECRKFAYETGVRPVVVYGGAPVGEQLRKLEQGCDVLVATPGRLVDLIDRRRVCLSQVWCPCAETLFSPPLPCFLLLPLPLRAASWWPRMAVRDTSEGAQHLREHAPCWVHVKICAPKARWQLTVC